MINTDFLNEAMGSITKAAEEMGKTLSGIERHMDETIKAVPEADKNKVASIGATVKAAIKAAKNGDSQTIENLIKNFKSCQ